MIYGYCVIKCRIENDVSTDYQDEAVCDVKKVRLFLTEKERDTAARNEYIRSIRNGWYNKVEKFVTKGEQCGLIILPKEKHNKGIKIDVNDTLV